MRKLNKKKQLHRIEPIVRKKGLRLPLGDWPLVARPEQLPPHWSQNWATWLLIGGRGSGKTRAGAEWVRAMASGHNHFAPKPVRRIALVGETYADGREVMIEGESGILALCRDDERPVWTSSRRRLEWPNGAIAQVFSSEDPDALRGPQFDVAWCDEVGKWRNAQETWDMLQFSVRLGARPCQCVTTTPRTTPLMKKLLADETTHSVRMMTRDNRENLAPGFYAAITNAYEGTRLGRQELDGEMIEDRANALWNRGLIEGHRIKAQPVLRRIVVAVDPPVTGKVTSDACGMVVAGRGDDDRAYVLADRTLNAVSPSAWGDATAMLAKTYGADRVVIETNQGGDMAESVLRQSDPMMPIRQVKANRGKWLRAEPVAHLYERGLVSHVGHHPQLEDEMCDFGLDGLSSNASPDRLDALVWALSDLMLNDNPAPRVRSL
ncbi:DNA-packaging protein [Pseudahrensia aquimaris]|uniref:DNA-packaging protein n=1 Tax=Pseudahrensia aquimaris TaxID=744461 RepID=A0ABW3FD94_9HYPH